MTRLVAILVTLFLVAIPAKADVALWPRPVPGWTVIQVYGVITEGDFDTFVRYTENVDPAATLVIVTGPGGHLLAGIGMGLRVHEKKLIVGVMGMCYSSCALIWIGGETGRKFLYQNRGTGLCFHQASELRAGLGNLHRTISGISA
jgi:ATP-dependent protease ClpP protease subunit